MSSLTGRLMVALVAGLATSMGPALADSWSPNIYVDRPQWRLRVGERRVPVAASKRAARKRRNVRARSSKRGSA